MNKEDGETNNHSNNQSFKQSNPEQNETVTIPIDEQPIIQSNGSPIHHSNDFSIRIESDHSSVIPESTRYDHSIKQSNNLSVDESSNPSASSDDEDSALIDSVQQSIEENFIAKTEQSLLERFNDHRNSVAHSLSDDNDLLARNAEICRVLNISNQVIPDDVSTHSNSINQPNNQSILIDAVDLDLIENSLNHPISPRSISRRSSLSIGSNYRNNRSLHQSIDLTNNPSLNQLNQPRRPSHSHFSHQSNNQSISKIDDQDVEEQHRWLTHANLFLDNAPNLFDQSNNQPDYRTRRQSYDLSHEQSNYQQTDQLQQSDSYGYDQSHNQLYNQSNNRSNVHSTNRDDQLYDQSNLHSTNQSNNQSVTRLNNQSVYQSNNQSDYQSNNPLQYKPVFHSNNQSNSRSRDFVDDEKKAPQHHQLSTNQFVSSVLPFSRSFTPVINPSSVQLHVQNNIPSIDQASSNQTYPEHRLARSVSQPVAPSTNRTANQSIHLSISPNLADSLLLPDVASALSDSQSFSQSATRPRGHSRSRSFRYSPSLSAQNLVNQSINEPHQFFHQSNDEVIIADDEKDFKGSTHHQANKRSIDQPVDRIAKKIEFDTPSKDEHERALPFDLSIDSTINQTTNASSKPAYQSNNHHLHPHSNHAIDESKSRDHSVNQSTNQPIQSISQSSWLSPIYQSKIVGFPRLFLQSILTCLLCSPPTPALTNIQSNNLLITSKHCLIDCTLLSSSNQSNNQSINQSSLPHDIANALRILFPFSVSTLICTPDTLPSDLYQSINQSINRTTNQSNNQSNKQSNNQSINQFNGPLFSEICILHRIDQLSPVNQSIINQAIRVKQISVNGRIINLPKTHLIIATHSHIQSNNQSINQSINLSHPHHQSIKQSTIQPNNQSMSRSLLDCFLFDLVVEPGFVNELKSFKQSHGVLIRQSINQSNNQTMNQSPNQSINQSINQPVNMLPSQLHIWPLLVSLTHVTLVAPLRAYIDDIIVCVRHHCRVMLGANQSINQSISVAACFHALIDGRSYVRPDDIDAIVENVLAHRITIRSNNQTNNQTNGFSYTARAIVKHLVKNVLRPPK